jgi:hypothetical protein
MQRRLMTSPPRPATRAWTPPARRAILDDSAWATIAPPRAAAAANGGQVLLSEVTTNLADGRLPGDLRLLSLGAHRLKDLRPERIAQLVIEGLPDTFPPIRSLDARPNNLPTALTSFVGRERELAEARELLETSRLVTLTGPGGTGKTRLALQLAALVADDYPDGMWFVPLGAVTDAALVVPAITGAIGIGDNPARSPLDVLAGELEGRRVLLVLDNLEQVRSASGDIAELLLRTARVRILATSRAPLWVSGEQEYRARPAWPRTSIVWRRSSGPEAPAGATGRATFGTVRLFIARRRRRPSQAWTGTRGRGRSSPTWGCCDVWRPYHPPRRPPSTSA